MVSLFRALALVIGVITCIVGLLRNRCNRRPRVRGNDLEFTPICSGDCIHTLWTLTRIDMSNVRLWDIVNDRGLCEERAHICVASRLDSGSHNACDVAKPQ